MVEAKVGRELEELDATVSWMRERGVFELRIGDVHLRLGPAPVARAVEPIAPPKVTQAQLDEELREARESRNTRALRAVGRPR